MSTEKFSKQVFEDTLTAILDDRGYEWMCVGIIGRDYRYKIQISEYVYVNISSSIDSTGFAADAAEDSIRVWLTDNMGMPLGNKTQRWVTRVAGWGDRLATVLDKTLTMGEAIMYCNVCNTVENVFVVKKEGKNKGRIYAKCKCPNSFTWLDEQEEVAEPESLACPKCGGAMQLRSRKSDGNKFWGCKAFPACTGTRDYSEFAAEGRDPEMETSHHQNVISPVEKSTSMIWSSYQVEIFRKVQSLRDGENIVIEAFAGTGKTTTIAQSTKLLPRDKKIVVVVFNKHNVQPVKDKVPDYVKVCTYHSLGFSACRKQWGDIVVDEKKLDGILETILDKDIYRYLFPTIRQFVSLVKANLTGTSDAELNDIAEYYGIELNSDLGVVFQAVRTAIGRCMEMTKVIDYDDMCWLPIVHNVTMEKYDYVYIDEAQDTNKNQIAIALASVSEDGHVIAVGDRYQSMYGFRGADANAIPQLIDSLEATVLPLSITYRNPQCVVDLVRQKFPSIPLEGTGKVGDISYMSYEQALAEYAAGDMVLCRTNAPLVSPVFDLIRRGQKAIIRGRDIGKGLLSLIKKMKANDLTELLWRLEDYKLKEFSKLMAADKTSQAQSLTDKVETIIALADGVQTVYDLENRVNTIFSDESEGVVFSTIHRAKGLEAEKVYILGPDLLPHPMAKKAWELVQEANIEYVALTRTLRHLVYVPRKDSN